MGFDTFVMKVRRTLLCCRKDERRSLDIGEPTNVRKVDISDALPGLTDAQRKYIREKASSDAIHLLGLQSHPHTSPPTPTESITPPHSPSLAATSRMSSRQPSEALLNAASKDLPSVLPTPPRRTHNESSPPAIRMKSMKYPDTPPISRRLSFSSTSASSASTDNSALFEKLNQHVKESNRSSPAGARLHESFMTLNLEFDWEDKKNLSGMETPRTLSLSEGFEMQDTVGGYGGVGMDRTSPLARNKVVRRAVDSLRFEDCSVSDSDSGDRDREGEGSPFLKI